MGVDPLAGEYGQFSSYSYTVNNPIRLIDPNGLAPMQPDDDHYIGRDGSIRTVSTNDDYDRFFIQCYNACNEYEFRMIAQLNRTDDGLVQFPASGEGFGRYGTVDAGGYDSNARGGAETVGEGDHYVRPEVAAALFGTTSDLSDEGINILLGDMSSSNGSDPWQSGSMHHGGHGHNGNRSGMDADFRYINTSGESFQSSTATTDTQFSADNNSSVYNTAAKYGFRRKYQGSSGTSLPNANRAGGHNDHGHLGIDYGHLDWSYVREAPNN